MTDGGEGASNFNLYRFILGVAFYVWSALFFLLPAYAGFESPWWRGFVYVLGIFWFVIGSIGFGFEVHGLSRRSESFRLLSYVLLLLGAAAVLHLCTVYIPMATGLFVWLRVVAIVLSVPGSFLLLLGLARAIESLPSPTNRTDVILTMLGLLGALLPIVVSIFGSA